jgi:hypothetical protein
MSRVFTTRFLFHDNEFVALVSIRRGAIKPHYTIRLFDERLHNIVKNEVIECDGFDGYLQKLSLRSDLSRNLMHTIMNSIRTHLEKTNHTPAG